MLEFAEWLADTPFSQSIQAASWAIPTIQAIHILGIAVVIASVAMIDLRVIGWGGPRTTVRATVRRFAPWLWGALLVLAVTGSLLIIAEPIRQFFTVSFWVKMSLLAVGIIVAVSFQISLARNGAFWEESGSARWRIKVAGLLTLGVWLGILVMGRFIAFDEAIWLSLSPNPYE
jgi:hypothetical protein